MDTTKILFRQIDFISHSGYNLKWKIECDALSDEELETLAIVIKTKIENKYSRYLIKDIIGIPSGGLRIAEQLKKQVEISESGTLVIIVDDVLTTGKSMEEYKKRYSAYPCLGFVLFARGTPYKWIKPVFQLWGIE